MTGDPLDSLLFEVELDSGETPGIHFRYADLVLLDEHEAALREELDEYGAVLVGTNGVFLVSYGRS